MFVLTMGEKTYRPRFFQNIPEINDFLQDLDMIDSMQVFNQANTCVQEMAYGPVKFDLIASTGMTVVINVPGSRLCFSRVPTAENVVDSVFSFSDALEDDRTLDSIFKYLMEEIGELATELNIIAGHSNKISGADGVFGEAVDVILCIVDLIRIYDPTITNEEIISMIKVKGKKWVNKFIADEHVVSRIKQNKVMSNKSISESNELCAACGTNMEVGSDGPYCSHCGIGAVV